MTENENLEKQIADDLSAVLKEAKSMGCKEVAYFRHIPLQNVEVVIQALEIVAKMKKHCEGSCTDCPYWNPKFDKCMNDLLKGVDGHE